MRFKILIILLIVTIPAILFTGQITSIMMSIDGELSNCKNSINIQGENKDVVVKECPSTIYLNMLYSTGISEPKAYASINGDIILFKGEKINKSLLYHELGHTIGYGHSRNATVMASSKNLRNKHGRKINKKAVRIAKEYEGFKFINWSSKSDRIYIKNEIENNNISKTNQYIIESNMEYYKDTKCNGIYFDKIPDWSDEVNNKMDFYIKCQIMEK